jgi:uncharacterized protein YlaI
MYRCAQGHIWPVALTCHQRFCPRCAERISLKLVKKYDSLDVGPDSILYLEITQYNYLSREFAESFGKFIGHGFKSLEHSAEAPIGTLWNTVVSPGRITARLILWGDGTKQLERYRAAWPNAIVKISSRPAHQFHETLHQAFAPKLHKNSIFLADCEFFFHGRRMVHTMGTLHMKPKTTLESPTSDEGVNELFPQENTSGNNSEPIKGHTCPKCHERAIAVTSRKDSKNFHHSTLGFNWWGYYREPVQAD